MSGFNNQNQTEPTAYEDLYLIGTVVDNLDPDKLERIKATVPGLWTPETNADLPWIIPVLSVDTWPSPGQGEFAVPDIGTTVLIKLQKGDAQYPMYVGTTTLKANRIAEAGVNYPNRAGFKDKAGNVFYIDRTSGINEVFFKHASGTTITIDLAGNVSINGVGKLTGTFAGAVALSTQQDMTLTAAGLVTIRGSTINLN